VRLYIAGPMTGLPDFNYPAFFAAAVQLQAAGHEPINPARSRPGVESQGASWLTYMRHSLRDIADCDGIATLPGHHNSRGARIECDLVERLGLPVLSVDEWLADAQVATQ